MSLSGDYGVPLPANVHILPRLAFILGRIALIFQNRFAVTRFFCNFVAN